MVKDRIILIGGFHELIELCNVCEKEIVGIIDNRIKESFLGYEILGADRDAKKIFLKYDKTSAIVVPDNPKVRKRLVESFSKIGFRFSTLLHPAANISKYAKLGNGVVINFGVNISANAVIGDFVKVNTSANVMHDAHIGNYTTLAPNSVILGRVCIEELCYIGSNSTILPGLRIGSCSIIGAGSVVTKDVKNGTTVAGNPAKIIRSRIVDDSREK
jgi:sugar O-acyltransferase (sialic acid O-acetyltransferase NeuD family)